jgi:hypothetical protein
MYETIFFLIPAIHSPVKINPGSHKIQNIYTVYVNTLYFMAAGIYFHWRVHCRDLVGSKMSSYWQLFLGLFSFEG